MGKKPKGRSPSGAGRAPQAAPAQQSTQGENPHFCFQHADRATTQPYRFHPDGSDAQELVGFMCDMARLTWREIESQFTGERRRRRKHHSQAVSSLKDHPKADFKKARLDRMFGDDEMFRFRLGGEKRLWGFRRGRVFHAVWLDPGHAVAESKKRHT